jgi:hypothetical protein
MSSILCSTCLYVSIFYPWCVESYHLWKLMAFITYTGVMYDGWESSNSTRSILRSYSFWILMEVLHDFPGSFQATLGYLTNIMEMHTYCIDSDKFVLMTIATHSNTFSWTAFIHSKPINSRWEKLHLIIIAREILIILCTFRRQLLFVEPKKLRKVYIKSLFFNYLKNYRF